MEAHLESFICSAGDGGFSAAARRLGVTPAGVSKNVGRLEASLGVRLFRRSTRKLSLTEEGEQFLREVAEPWHRIQDAVAVVRMHFVPMLAEFRRRYPEVLPDLHFDNRQVDLIAQGFDVAIGGGVELPPVEAGLSRT